MPVWNKPNKPHPNSNRFHSNNSGGGSGGGGNNNGPSPPGGGGGGHHNSNNNSNKPPYYHHNSRRNSNPFHHNNNNHYNSNNNNNSNSNNNSFNNNKNNNHSYHHRPNHHNNHINRPNFGGGHHSNRGRGGNHRSNFQSSSHYHSSSNSNSNLNSNSIGNSNSNNNSNSNSIGNNNSISNITNNNSSSNYGVGSNNANNVSGNSSGKTIDNMNRDNHNNSNSNTGSTMNTGLNSNNKIISGNNNNSSGIGNRTLSMSASGSMSMSSSIPSSVSQKEQQQQQPSHQRHHSSVEEGEIGEISSVSKMDTSSKNRLNSIGNNANNSMNTNSGDIGNGKISSSINSNSNSNSNNVSNKFIPPLLSTATPSSSISISSLKKNNNNREEGEIQPSPTAPSTSMSMPMSKSISTPNSISNNRSNIHNNSNNHNNTSTISSSAFNNSSNSNSNSNTNATPNTNTNKPTWTPPPGASSSSNTNTSNTNTMNNNIGSMSTNMGMNIINSAHTHAHHNNNKPKLKPTNAMNNAPNHYYHGRNNNSNNIGLNANSINSNSGSNMNNHGPPRKNNWGGGSQYNHNNNTNNSYNSNREQSREHIRERDDGIGNNSQKWDKPNHLKKRFSSDGVTSGSNSNSTSIGVNSGGNIGGRGGIGSNNGGSNSAITHGIGNDSSGGGGGGGFYRSTSLPVSSSLSSNRRRNTLNPSTIGGGGMTKSTSNAMMDSSSISGGPRGSHLSLGGDYYGPSSTSSEKGKLARNSNMGEPNSLNGDGTVNGSNSLYSSMSDVQKNRDNFSPNTIRKKFQPPPGKEKKTFFSSPPPPNHSNTSSSIPFSDRDPKNMIKRQATMEKIKPAPSSPERNIKRTLSMESDGRKHVSDTRWKPAGTSNFDASTGISASANKSSTRSPPAFNTDKKKNKSSTTISVKERASLLGQQKAEPRIASSSSVLSAPSLKNKDSMILNNKSASSIEGTQSATSGPTPTPQSKLTCAALGNQDNIVKAKKVIYRLSLIISDDSFNVITGRVNSMPLPSKDQIHHGMKNLESEIVRRKSDCDKMKAAHEKEEKERKKQQEEKAKAIAEAARKKEQEEKERVALEKERAAQERLREQEARKDSELKMNNHIKEVTERIEKEKKAEESRLKSELDEMKVSLVSIGKQIEDQKQKREEARVERKRLILEAETRKSLVENTVVILKTEVERKEARKAFALAKNMSEQSDKKVKSAKVKKLNAAIKLKESSKATAEIIADTSVPELVESNNRLSEKISTGLKNILSLTKDEPKDMTNLISSIYQQNREVAYEAHQRALSLISCAHNSDSVLPPALVQEQPINVDDTNAVRQYTNHWSNLTRQVTGPGDALYTEPSEAPLYKSNSENHKSMKSLVKERVMSKKRKLHSRWVELAEEYTIREQKYSKGAKIDASSFTSADVGDLPILAGTNDYNPDVGSSGRSSGNPYRRARRGVANGSDAVRSEYEQEQIIAQLVAKENMEKRIKLGRSELPRQKCQLEKELLVSYRDTLSSRRVFDPLEEALDQRNINPWSDIEKCIFLDRFLQHPKDFRKIASFLKNKSVHDCISFYYDSKQSVPYKRALREHSKRKKRRGDSVKWEATIQAAISVGASVNVGISSEKPLIFELPRNDLTFNTRHFHPMGRKIFDVVSGVDSHSIEIATIQDVKKNSHRKRSIMVGNLFTLDASKRKYLRSYPDMIGKSIGSGSDDLDEKQKVRRTSDSPSVHDSIKKEKSEVSKKIPQKWSTEEKTIFYEMIEKVGKKWDILSQAVGTKTAIQVKNFYSDNKKHINKNRATVNPKVSTSTNPIEEQKIPSSVNPPTEEVKPTPVVTQPLPTIEATEAPKVNHGFAQENIIGNQPQEQEREPVDQGHQIQSNQNQTEHWMHDNQKRQQLALAIEHHRQQQQFAEQQQQHRMSHQLSQSQQQQLLEFQRQQQQQRQLSQHHHHLQQQHQHHQLQNLLNHRQNEYSHGHQQQMMSNLNWVAVAQAAMEARQQQQRPYQDYLEGGTNLQNVTMALRQATQHQQNNYQMGLNSNRSADNDGSQMQQTSDLSLLAQMAVNRNRQDSRNH